MRKNGGWLSRLLNVDALNIIDPRPRMGSLPSFTVIEGSRIYAVLSRPAVAPPCRGPGDAAGGVRYRWRWRRLRPRRPRVGCGGRDGDGDGSPRDACRGDSDD